MEMGRAKVFLREGKGREAKKLLKPFLNDGNKKIKILYFLSCFPAPIIKMVTKNRF